MDEEITEQKAVSFNDDSQRNSLQVPFIFRLPTEILETLFIHLARVHYRRYSGPLIPHPPSWINVSYVCCHWRNVALNCPTLWTYLFIVSPRWTEELLARSKQAPLKLHVEIIESGEASRALRFIEPILNHIGRIQELKFRILLALVPWRDLFFSKLSLPAPLLEDWQISMSSISPGSWWPSVLFDGDTLALRTLELKGCPVPWYSSRLSGLTTLSLSHISVRLRQSIAEFLATLGYMQDLTHLYLDHSLASAARFLSSPTFNTFHKINLPHLSRLWIAASLSTVIALLSCINIPLETEVRLECNAEHVSSLDYYASLTSLLAQRFNTSYDQTLSGQTIRSLTIDFFLKTMKLTCSASERDFSISYPRGEEWGCNIPLQTLIDFGESIENPDDRDRITTDILRSIPLANVQSLCVFDPPFSSAFWRKTLGHLPDLRYLKLNRGRLPNLAPLLSGTPHDYAEKQVGCAPLELDRVLAPALEELELCRMVVAMTPQESDVRNQPIADIRLLCTALSSRAESRGRFTVAECDVMAKSHIIGMLDQVGSWGDGHFCVVEDRSQGMK